MAVDVALSSEGVREALRELGEFLDERAVAALARAAADDRRWAVAQATPREYLLAADVTLPERLDIRIGPFGGLRGIGRRCFTVCRSIDPVPLPPDPTGITVCVQICIPSAEPGGPRPGPTPPTERAS